MRNGGGGGGGTAAAAEAAWNGRRRSERRVAGKIDKRGGLTKFLGTVHVVLILWLYCIFTAYLVFSVSAQGSLASPLPRPE